VKLPLPTIYGVYDPKPAREVPGSPYLVVTLASFQRCLDLLRDQLVDARNDRSEIIHSLDQFIGDLESEGKHA
jgi:hypothetical protein